MIKLKDLFNQNKGIDSNSYNGEKFKKDENVIQIIRMPNSPNQYRKGIIHGKIKEGIWHMISATNSIYAFDVKEEDLVSLDVMKKLKVI